MSLCAALQATRWSEKQALWIGDAHDMWGVKWEDEWWLKKWCAKVPVNLKIDIIAKVSHFLLLLLYEAAIVIVLSDCCLKSVVYNV